MTSTTPIRAGLLLLFAAFVGEVLYVTIGSNFRVLDPGKCYRCAQPTADFLIGRSRRDGIKTIVNLRGENSGKDWYDAERAAAEAEGILMVDVPMSSNCPPSTDQFRQLIALIDEAPRPLIFHCHSGSDRTGLASMTYLLLQTDCTFERAKKEISFRYGHKFWSEAVRLWAIPDAYEEWLKGRGEAHSPARFREWGTTVYTERDAWRRLGISMP